MEFAPTKIDMLNIIQNLVLKKKNTIFCFKLILITYCTTSVYKMLISFRGDATTK